MLPLRFFVALGFGLGLLFVVVVGCWFGFFGVLWIVCVIFVCVCGLFFGFGFFFFWKKEDAIYCISAFHSDKGMHLPSKGRIFQIFLYLYVRGDC